MLEPGEVGGVLTARDGEEGRLDVPAERRPGDEGVVLVLGARADEEEAGGGVERWGGGAAGGGWACADAGAIANRTGTAQRTMWRSMRRNFAPGRWGSRRRGEARGGRSTVELVRMYGVWQLD